jgi:hypothetical protein
MYVVCLASRCGLFIRLPGKDLADSLLPPARLAPGRSVTEQLRGLTPSAPVNGVVLR